MKRDWKLSIRTPKSENSSEPTKAERARTTKIRRRKLLRNNCREISFDSPLSPPVHGSNGKLRKFARHALLEQAEVYIVRKYVEYIDEACYNFHIA